MSEVVLNLVSSELDINTSTVEVTVTASGPGPAGPGVPVGGTVNQVLTKDSSTDYDTSWQDAQGGGGGAPDDADYLVGTAHGDLSAEIVVGTSPGGELGGTWASPTVDATHSGSSHASVQAAAEATAAAALATHTADTTAVHGIADTSVLATASDIATHAADTTSVHGIADTSVVMLEGDTAGGVLGGTYPNPSFAADMATQAELNAHEADTTSVHGIADTSALALSANVVANATFNDHSARHEDGGADEISIAGLAGTSVELSAHLADTTDAHDASAISFSPTGTIASTDVQAAIAEVASEAGSGSTDPSDVNIIVHMEVFA